MKRLGPIAGVVLVFILTALALIKVYDKGKEQKPLRYAEVPQETIDWINSLSEGLGDILSTFNPIPKPTPWDNGADIGKDPDSGLSTMEDKYFIIYYPDSFVDQAKLTLQYAHKAIPRMEEIIGKYYYPEDMNGRKVPIYLGSTKDEYLDLYKKVGHVNKVNENTAGVCIYEVSPSGLFLTGIILDGSYVFSKKSLLNEVLWHEMTHYCFGASLNYNYAISLPEWCTEGIAEYTGIVARRPKFSQEAIDKMREDCDMTAPYFPYVFENYNGGHSIFCHMEDRYNVSGVQSFLQTLYGSGVQASLKENFNTTVEEFESDWKANLDKFM